MPPKIRKVVVRQPAVLGCGRQYLMANFDAQPEASNSGSCKNGHVLLIYVQNAKSIVKTIDLLCINRITVSVLGWLCAFY